MRSASALAQAAIEIVEPEDSGPLSPDFAPGRSRYTTWVRSDPAWPDSLQAVRISARLDPPLLPRGWQLLIQGSPVLSEQPGPLVQVPAAGRSAGNFLGSYLWMREPGSTVTVELRDAGGERRGPRYAVRVLSRGRYWVEGLEHVPLPIATAAMTRRRTAKIQAAAKLSTKRGTRKAGAPKAAAAATSYTDVVAIRLAEPAHLTASAQLWPPFSDERRYYEIVVPYHVATARISALLDPAALPSGWTLRIDGQQVASGQPGPLVQVPEPRDGVFPGCGPCAGGGHPHGVDVRVELLDEFNLIQGPLRTVRVVRQREADTWPPPTRAAPPAEPSTLPTEVRSLGLAGAPGSPARTCCPTAIDCLACAESPLFFLFAENHATNAPLKARQQVPLTGSPLRERVQGRA